MDTRTQRPSRSTARSGTPPRTGRVGRIVLTALIVTLVLTAAVLVSVLYGTGSETTPPPRPGVSPVQLERWGANDVVEEFDHEHQSLRSMVRPADVDAPAADFDHEHQSLRSMRDRDR